MPVHVFTIGEIHQEEFRAEKIHHPLPVLLASPFHADKLLFHISTLPGVDLSVTTPMGGAFTAYPFTGFERFYAGNFYLLICL